MKSLFKDCSSLISLPNISKWNVENVKDMDQMFSGCSSLLIIPNITKWKLNKSIRVDNLFNDITLLVYNKSSELSSFKFSSNKNMC